MKETINEINSKYDGQWVYLIDCEQDDYGTILSGSVVLSSQSRDSVIRHLKDFEDVVSLTSLRYAGKIPAEVNIIL